MDGCVQPEADRACKGVQFAQWMPFPLSPSVHTRSTNSTLHFCKARKGRRHPSANFLDDSTGSRTVLQTPRKMLNCVVCEAAASLYCASDKAWLCKGCDVQIHAQNAVAARHGRVPACELCAKVAATSFCRNDNAFLCEACNVHIHAGNPLAARHEVIPALEAAAQLVRPLQPLRPPASGSAADPSLIICGLLLLPFCAERQRGLHALGQRPPAADAPARQPRARSGGAVHGPRRGGGRARARQGQGRRLQRKRACPVDAHRG